jgi:hypothetical protein
MSENLMLGLNVTAVVFGGLILVAIVGVIIDRIAARNDRTGGA